MDELIRKRANQFALFAVGIYLFGFFMGALTTWWML